MYRMRVNYSFTQWSAKDIKALFSLLYILSVSKLSLAIQHVQLQNLKIISTFPLSYLPQQISCQPSIEKISKCLLKFLFSPITLISTQFQPQAFLDPGDSALFSVFFSFQAEDWILVLSYQEKPISWFNNTKILLITLRNQFPQVVNPNVSLWICAVLETQCFADPQLLLIRPKSGNWFSFLFRFFSFWWFFYFFIFIFY